MAGDVHGNGPNEPELSFIEKIKGRSGAQIYKEGFRYIVDPLAKLYDGYRRILGPIIEHLFALFLLGFSVYEIVSEKKLPEYLPNSNTDQTIAYLSAFRHMRRSVSI